MTGISAWDLILEFEKEWNKLEREEWCETDFTKGLIQGLKLAKSMTKQMSDNEKARLGADTHEWKCHHLKSMEKAIDQIKRGDRLTGMRTLQKVLDRARKAEKVQEVKPPRTGSVFSQPQKAKVFDAQGDKHYTT